MNKLDNQTWSTSILYGCLIDFQTPKLIIVIQLNDLSHNVHEIDEA
jgi:hypothetical protein